MGSLSFNQSAPSEEQHQAWSDLFAQLTQSALIRAAKIYESDGYYSIEMRCDEHDKPLPRVHNGGYPDHVDLTNDQKICLIALADYAIKGDRVKISSYDVEGYHSMEVTFHAPKVETLKQEDTWTEKPEWYKFWQSPKPCSRTIEFTDHKKRTEFLDNLPKIVPLLAGM